MTNAIQKLFLLFTCVIIIPKESFTQERWTGHQAENWSKQHPWPVGCNYIPAKAINQLEMWQSATFDTATINEELGYAESIGMNTLRVFLHDLLWKQDCKGFKKRIGQFLAIASRHHIQPAFVFFDDCWSPDPKLGKQPDPIPGRHNSGWVRSPSQAVHDDSTRWGYLELYVKDILRTFKDDRRILFWDLYNEPGNSGYGDHSEPLLRKVFQWARAVNPSQPLTVGIWDASFKGISAMQLNKSDIISFHNYGDSAQLRKQIENLQAYKRPLVCTEWLARGYGSQVATNLPLFHQYKVGAINWGFVSGKTNTIYPWTSLEKPFTEEPVPWHHDLFHSDGAPYDENEVELFRKLTGKKTARPVDAIISELHNPNGKSILVAAHRADWRNNPENSIAAVKSAIAMGVDIIEVDVKKTKDGQLVIMHDYTLDRTTTGKGRVEDYTLDTLKTLYLRNGYRLPTRHRIPTLEEVMLAAKGKAMVNLDHCYPYIREAYAILQKTGTVDHALFKGEPIADSVISKYSDILPHITYMPIIGLNANTPDTVMNPYLRILHPVAFELIFDKDSFPILQHLPALGQSQARLWVNTLWPSLCGGHDDDLAYDEHNTEVSWGWMIRKGFTIIQTDRPAALLAYLRKRKLHR